MPHFPSATTPPESSPNLGELERYVQGRMSEGERTAFEQAWGDDPFVADAIEGLQQLPSKQVHKRLQYLRRQGQERVLLRSRHSSERQKRGNRVRPLWWPQATLALVAGLALLLLVGILIPRRPAGTDATAPAETNATAEMAPLPPTTTEEHADLLASAPRDSTVAPAEVTPSPQLLAARDLSSSRSSPPTPAPTPPEPTARKEIAALAPSAQELPASSAFESEAVGAISKDSEPEMYAREEALLDDETASARAAESALQLSPRSPQPSAKRPYAVPAQPDSSAALLRLRQSFAQQAWSETRQAAQAVLETHPDDPEARYYLGASAYWQGQPERAIRALRQVSPAAEGWYERAQWTLAQAYLADQQPEAAREILTRLIQASDLYRDAAEHLLDEMD
jgi:hypothetical protein